MMYQEEKIKCEGVVSMVGMLMGICLMCLGASMIQGNNNNDTSSTSEPNPEKKEFSIWAKENDYSFKNVREQLSLRYFSGDVDDIARKLRTDNDYRYRVEKTMEWHGCSLEEAIERVDD